MTDVPPGPAAQVSLTWDLWCPRHLEPYRANWPDGAGVAMMRLFDAAVKMPAVSDAAGGQSANLTAALRRFAPLCCFISREALQAIYDETVAIGPGGLCTRTSCTRSSPWPSSTRTSSGG